MRKSDRKCLWEILVPVHWPDNNEFIPIVTHQSWDIVVREISKGMTILRSAIGEWQDGDTIVRERMIPVRLLATRKQLMKILEFTKEFYRQKTVMAYKLSKDIIMYE